MPIIKILDAVQTRTTPEGLTDNQAMNPSQFPSAAGSACWSLSDFHEVLTGQTGFIGGLCSRYTSDFEKPFKGVSDYTQRSEDQLRDEDIREPLDIWHSYYFRIPSATYTQEDVHVTQLQWHSGGGSPQFSLFARDGHLGCGIIWDTQSFSTSRMEFWFKPHQLDFVHKIIIRHQFRPDTSGRTTVWLDGEIATLYEPRGNPWMVPASYSNAAVGLYEKGLNNGDDALPMVKNGANLMDWWGKNDKDPATGTGGVNKYYKQGFYISARNSRYDFNVTDPCDPAVITNPLSNPAFNVKIADIGSVRFWVPEAGETDEDAYRALSDDGSLSADTPSDFTFNPAPTYTLTTQVNNAAWGSITEVTTGPYEENDNVQVSATPNTGYQFDGFTSVQVADSSNNPYSFSMPGENVVIQANFSEIPPDTYTLTLSADPIGLGTVDKTPAGPHEENDVIALSATPGAGNQFDGWYDGQTLLSTDNPYNYTMPGSNKTITGKFSEITYTLTIQVNNIVAGSIEENTVGPYVEGDPVQVSAFANTGYVFGEFASDQITNSGDNPHTFSMPAQNVTVTAMFYPTYTLTLEVDPLGFGTVDTNKDGPYQSGETISLSAVPGSGNEFLGWYDEETLLSTANPYVYTMPSSSKTITGLFAESDLDTYSLTLVVSPSGYGTATKNITGPHLSGTKVQLLADPGPNRKFLGWYDGITLLSANNPYTYTTGGTDKTITALFEDGGVIIARRMII